MKILLVSQYFWPETFRVNDVVAALQERGHAVTVLCGIPNYPAGRPFPGYSAFGPAGESYCGSRVVRVPLVPRGSSRLQLAVNYFSYVASACLLGPWRCRDSYDCVLVYQLSPVTVGIPGAVMKWARRAPMAMWVQDLWPHSLEAVGAVRSRWALDLVQRMVTWIYRRCDLILLQSPRFAAEVSAAGGPEEALRYLPNWSEPFYRPVERASAAAEDAALPKGFRALFAGNLGEAQSLETILGAAERTRDLVDFHWVLLGDGSRREWLVAEIARRGLQATVHWIARRPAEEMPRWFAAADALVVTLNSGPAMALTVPVKVQSYLACARPILAALDGEGARVVASSGAGLISPPEDAVKLSQHAREFYLESPANRTEIGLRGREYFLAHYEREHLVDRLEELLRELSAQHDRT